VLDTAGGAALVGRSPGVGLLLGGGTLGQPGGGTRRTGGPVGRTADGAGSVACCGCGSGRPGAGGPPPCAAAPPALVLLRAVETPPASVRSRLRGVMTAANVLFGIKQTADADLCLTKASSRFQCQQQGRRPLTMPGL